MATFPSREGGFKCDAGGSAKMPQLWGQLSLFVLTRQFCRPSLGTYWLPDETDRGGDLRDAGEGMRRTLGPLLFVCVGDLSIQSVHSPSTAWENQW